MRFDFDSLTDKTGWLFSLNYIDVLQSTPTSVGDGVVPGALRLAQNHPNPFNPLTTITYVVPSDGPVRVTVFDPRGREVRLLVDERQTVGEHAVSWDGRNDDGRSLASGVYFYHLEAAGSVLIGKMILLK